APRAWYKTLATYLLENGFQKGTIDQTLFIKTQQKDILLVQIYVDDIIFGATNKALCQSFEKLMKDKFQMSSMGELTFFLGLQRSLLLKDSDGEDVDMHTYSFGIQLWSSTRVTSLDAEARIPTQDDDVQEHAEEEVATNVVPPTPTSPSPSSPVLNTCSALVLRVEVDQEKNAEIEGRQANKQAEIYNIDLDHSSKVVVASTPISAAKPKYIKRYPGFKKKPKSESEARKNMISYLKNTKGINETPAQKATKRRKLSEEAQEADDLKKRLEIVQDEDDDVFVEATPLAQKVPVVDYQVVVIDNKPRIVKDRFFTKKPTNFSDEYLLLTLKTMFGELDEQDAIWKNQKSVHGLALVKRWKLLTLCGVHVIILSIVQLFLLVEKRYPLSRLTLEQLVNVARLQVEEESEISLELLRFTR
nr:putative ribonuclease H-like domain-containing protein [Tanacetum cinerariifolium]